MSQLRNITQEEWEKYEWTDASTYEDLSEDRAVYIRGILKDEEPPRDGNVYVRHRYDNQWIPAMTRGRSK